MAYTATHTKQYSLGGTTPNAPGTAVLGTSDLNLEAFTTATFDISSTGATGGPLDIYVQSSIDNGVTWYDVAHLPQLAAAAALARYTFSLTRGYRQASVAPNAANTNSGTPALAANTVIPDNLGNALRVIVVAGALTTAGTTVTAKVLVSQ